MKLAEVLARMMEAARGPGALERVGAEFNRGAKLPGTYERGRALADTPEGLATQFDWNTPKVVSQGYDLVLGFPEPGGEGIMATLQAMGKPGADKYWKEELGGMVGHNGLEPFLRPGVLPDDARFHLYDTQALNNSGAGKRVYPVLYGNTLIDPGAYNIKAGLTGDNSHRANYNLASMIGRRPDSGERLLTSPEQFPMLEADPVKLRLAGPDVQMGTLQTEGALQALRRMLTASKKLADGQTKQLLEDLPGRLGTHMSPQDIEFLAKRMRGYLPNDTSLRTLGPSALRKLAITQDVLNERPVNPAAYRKLEFRSGGLAQAFRGAVASER